MGEVEADVGPGDRPQAVQEVAGVEGRGDVLAVQQHALIGLVHGLELGTKVFDHEEVGLDKGDLKRRIKAVAESAGPGADGVARAVQSANTAMITAITVATVSSTSGSS